ncbi:MAG: hypothetical protein LBV34_23890 [Nocardiopsaceae bacterium]|nr:hypothetical protein [Nocardiopsaceae bacterium]
MRDKPALGEAGRGNRAPDAHRRRVYLHIGEPKTGTTYVQQALWGCRAWLAAQGVVLPGYSDRDHFRASRDLRGVPKVASDPADRWAGEWDVLAGQALRVPGAAVISNELLAACTDRQADRAVRSLLPAEVHIVLTARDIASLLPAEWQEAVKCRDTVPWEQWLDAVISAAPDPDRRRRSWFWAVHDTPAILEMWSRHIPPDHVHVITVPGHGPAGALWARFASALGIESGGTGLPHARVNTSLGLVEAECLRRLNETLPGEMPNWFYTHDIRRILAREALRGQPPQARLTLPPGQQAWARRQAEILAAGLRDSKCHVVGDLGELLPPPATEPYVSPSLLSADQLLDAALHAAAALADHQYQKGHPGRQQQRHRPLSPRQRLSHLAWAALNGPLVKRALRNASHLAAVRRLRVAIWCVLIRPARHRLRPAPAGSPEDAG